MASPRCGDAGRRGVGHEQRRECRKPTAGKPNHVDLCARLRSTRVVRLSRAAGREEKLQVRRAQRRPKVGQDKGRERDRARLELLARRQRRHRDRTRERHLGGRGRHEKGARRRRHCLAGRTRARERRASSDADGGEPVRLLASLLQLADRRRHHQLGLDDRTGDRRSRQGRDGDRSAVGQEGRKLPMAQ